MSLEVKNILGRKVVSIEQEENSRVYVFQSRKDRDAVARGIHEVDEHAEIYRKGSKSILVFNTEYDTIREIANAEKPK